MSTIQAESRSTSTTRSELNQLRAGGKIPAVIYGKSTESEAIAVDAKQVFRLMKSNSGGVLQLSLPTDKAARPVMIADVQRDKLNGHIVHIDFHQVNMNEEVKTTVRLSYTGDPIGVKEQGGVLQIQVHMLDIRCKPNQIPAVVEVDVSHLNLAETVTVADIQIPEGVEVTNDPADVLASVTHAQKQEETSEETTEEQASSDGDAVAAEESAGE